MVRMRGGGKASRFRFNYKNYSDEQKWNEKKKKKRRKNKKIKKYPDIA